ncbi:MAG: signal recognition particle-docking protein FtsY [Desulfobacterales bacterium]|nr:signal recognition particle-docking protein FtsY [Desulfobacterales bacterium]
MEAEAPGEKVAKEEAAVVEEAPPVKEVFEEEAAVVEEASPEEEVPEEKAVVEEAPPEEEVPGEKAVVEEAPPEEEVPGEKAVVEEAPPEEEVAEEKAVVEEAPPVEEVPVEEAPVVEEAPPVEKVQVEEAAVVEEAPPVEEVPVEEAAVVEEAPPEEEKAEPEIEKPAKPEKPEKPEEPEKRIKPVGLFQRLKNGLAKTRKILTTDIDDLFAGKKELDDDLLEDLEELLITSDIGVRTSMDLIEKISENASKITGTEELKAALKAEIRALFDAQPSRGEEIIVDGGPRVVMVVGVNGVGKTTTIGKLAARCTASGQKVLIAAADTFRAAAVEQLTIWAERAGADIVRHKEKADPAAVAYDGVEAAIARGVDVVFVDTAGRLHTKVNLMEELKKIKRAIGKKIPLAPHEVLLVLDATTGQNALSQAELFNKAMNITGLALTKLDGTAKGGIVVGISSSLNIPLRYIGVGETMDDLQDFNPADFTDALF